MSMRILVINRIHDSACAEAMKLIPGAVVRAEDESNHATCQEAVDEFAPQIVVVSDPTDPEGIRNMDREDNGIRIWYPTSLLMREPPYSFFTNSKCGVGHSFPGITDLDELAIRVVENSVPEVSLLITDPDKSWQKILQKEFSEILGLVIHIHGEAWRSVYTTFESIYPEIVVQNWRGDFTPAPGRLRQYVRNREVLKIAVLSGDPERTIYRTAPDVDFVLCKASPLNALILMVGHWTEMIQIDKRRELREGLLRNQNKASRSS